MKTAASECALTLYHGSREGLKGPIMPCSRSACDFGRGFYLGTTVLQPLTLICRSPAPKLYTCEIDLTGLNVYRFEPDIDWVLFVAYCRTRMPSRFAKLFASRYREILRSCDVIVGKIANDKMFYALDFFFDNLASDTAVIKSIGALNLGDQYCLRTARACRRVQIVNERDVGPEESLKLQRRSEAQRKKAQAIVDRIMDENRRDGLLFREILEKRVEALS